MEGNGGSCLCVCVCVLKDSTLPTQLKTVSVYDSAAHMAGGSQVGL